ncbi:autotransporter-associated beta strand repeat-containing protein, partial [Brucella intermedia]|nr:autotransporter-associated beta strand repeat-containing protein [Brucella intermedia]
MRVRRPSTGAVWCRALLAASRLLPPLRTKNGDGDLVLYGENAYAGATTVNRGGLVQGAAGGFSSASAFAVAKGASIQLGGFETTIAGLANGGDVFFGGMGGTVLNIAGDYAGNDGTLHM